VVLRFNKFREPHPEVDVDSLDGSCRRVCQISDRVSDDRFDGISHRKDAEVGTVCDSQSLRFAIRGRPEIDVVVGNAERTPSPELASAEKGTAIFERFGVELETSLHEAHRQSQ
jgi:hypothetical protein